MIYFQSPDQKHVVILNRAEITRIASGEILTSPDQLVLMGYTPNEKWFIEKLNSLFTEVGQITHDSLLALMAMGRTIPPEVPAPQVNPTTKGT